MMMGLGGGGVLGTIPSRTYLLVQTVYSLRLLNHVCVLATGPGESSASIWGGGGG